MTATPAPTPARPSPDRIGWRHAVTATALALLAGAMLLAMGRSAICPCGTVKLWHGAVQSAENSQHLADWYSPSHVVHGLILYGLLRLVARRWPAGWRLVAAVAIEAAWEVAENSPWIIDRYRAATIAIGYTGDSVVNSLADIGWMAIGFLIARRLPAWATVTAGLALEAAALWAIRDNLTLNVLMLVSPVESVRRWQAG